MKGIKGQLSLFDYMQQADESEQFSWDADINIIYKKIRESMDKYHFILYKKEWSVWDHVPHYGYRMTLSIEVDQDQRTIRFIEELQEIVDFAKSVNIEITPFAPIFIGNAHTGTMYIFSTLIESLSKQNNP